MPIPAPRSALPSVVVVAQDRRVRASLSSLLSASGRVEVIGAARDAGAALAGLDGHVPQVVILDPRLTPAASAEAWLEQLRRELPDASVLIVEWEGALESSPLVPRADGVLDVGAKPAEVIEAILAGIRRTARVRAREV